MNCFRCIFVSLLLLTGQLPDFSTRFFKGPLSFFSLLHWKIKWSTDCVPCCSYWYYTRTSLYVPDILFWLCE